MSPIPRRLVITGLIGFGLAGCGPSCKEIRGRFREVSRGVARSESSAPDLRVRIPFRTLNRLAARVVADQVIEIEVPRPKFLKKLGPFKLPPLVARVNQVVLSPAPDRGESDERTGRLMATAVVDIRDPFVTWGTVRASVKLTPELVRRDGRAYLELRARPQDYSQIRPVFSGPLGESDLPEMAERLARSTGRALLSRLPKALLESAAAEVTRHLAGDGWRAIRDPLFRSIGEHVLWRVRLPDLPVRDVEVRSEVSGELLIADVHTDLPVATHIPPMGDSATGPAGGAGEIEVQMPVETAMAAANWAIDNGQLPQEYDRNLNPVGGGRYRPVFAWWRKNARRPLKIHIFCLTSPCSYMRVGFALELGMDGDRVRTRLYDRDIEATHGSALLEFGAALSNLLSSSTEKTRSAVASTEVTVGQTRLRTRATGISLRGSELVFMLALDE